MTYEPTFDATRSRIPTDRARPRTGERVIIIRAGALIAVLLFALALVLRLAEADTIPLTAGESREALAAFRAVFPGAAPATPYEAGSVIVFLAQAIGFALFGGSEMSARLFTAIAGAALTLAPFLFTRELGRGRALIFALLLSFSPVLLVGSRESAPVVWAALFAVGLARGLLTWNAARIACKPSTESAVIAGLCGAALIALCGATGLVTAAIVIGGLVTAGLAARPVPETPIPLDEDADTTAPPVPVQALRAFPWGAVLPGALLLVLGAGTGFLLYPAGLSAVGAGFAALPTWIGGGTLPLVVSLFYEPHLWALSVIGVVLLRRSGSGIDRFFFSASLIAVIAGLVFGGAPAANGLWIILPLAGLTSGVLARCFLPDEDSIFAPPPGWARGVVAVSLIMALLVFTVALHAVARAALQAPEGLISAIAFPGEWLVLLLVSMLFIVIGFFLFASLWGARTTWQGMALGIALFFGITGSGSGWAVAVSAAHLPVHVWSPETTGRDVPMLRTTLLSLIDREARGFPEYPVYALVPEDGPVAWTLRDFGQTVFIDDVREAVGQGAVILPASQVVPDLGTAYVGQDFDIRFAGLSPAYPVDFLAFWTQRQVRVPAMPSDQVVLWLRQDVYNGVMTDQ